MKRISPSIFKLIRNTGLVLLALWLVIWAYLYFTHSRLLWEKKKIYVPVIIESKLEKTSKVGTEPDKSIAKEPPFYQPVMSRQNYGPNGYTLYDLDMLEGIVEQISARVITIKLDHLRCDANGNIIRPGTSGYDDGFTSVQVKIPEEFTQITVNSNYVPGSGMIPIYGTFEDIKIGQRILIWWEKPSGSEGPLQLNNVVIRY